jgi:hypothetical protein
MTCVCTRQCQALELAPSTTLNSKQFNSPVTHFTSSSFLHFLHRIRANMSIRHSRPLPPIPDQSVLSGDTGRTSGPPPFPLTQSPELSRLPETMQDLTGLTAVNENNTTDGPPPSTRLSKQVDFSGNTADPATNAGGESALRTSHDILDGVRPNGPRRSGRFPKAPPTSWTGSPLRETEPHMRKGSRHRSNVVDGRDSKRPPRVVRNHSGRRSGFSTQGTLQEQRKERNVLKRGFGVRNYLDRKRVLRAERKAEEDRRKALRYATAMMRKRFKAEYRRNAMLLRNLEKDVRKPNKGWDRA